MEKAPIVLFDGVCNFCNYWVNFIIKHDKKGLLRFASLQGEYGQKIQSKFNLDSTKLDSVILVLNDQVYLYSDAVIGIGQQLGSFFKLTILFKIIPRPIRDYIYKFIAKNRYRWFGQPDCCMMPTPELKKKFLV
jgi:predicted DCC family thiol-disulfide oxidoreductase YuxK